MTYPSEDIAKRVSLHHFSMIPLSAPAKKQARTENIFSQPCLDTSATFKSANDSFAA